MGEDNMNQKLLLEILQKLEKQQGEQLIKMLKQLAEQFKKLKQENEELKQWNEELKQWNEELSIVIEETRRDQKQRMREVLEEEFPFTKKEGEGAEE